MNPIKRYQEPTPKFFNKLAKIGIGLVACATALMASPVALPAIVVTAANYILTVGIVVTAVSKLSVINEPDQNEK